MFKLVKEPVAPWPVKWNGVSPAGEIVEHSMILHFVAIDRDEFNRLYNRDADDAPALAEIDHVMRLARGWDDIFDAAGDPLPWSRENVARLLQVPNFSTAFDIAYLRFWTARPEVREKNSDTPSAGSTAKPEPAEAALSGSS